MAKRKNKNNSDKELDEEKSAALCDCHVANFFMQRVLHSSTFANLYIIHYQKPVGHAMAKTHQHSTLILRWWQTSPTKITKCNIYY